MRMAAEPLALVAVAADMVIVVVALEHRVVLHQPVVGLGDVGPQHGRREFAMILRRQIVADVVEQGDDHRLLVGLVAEGAGRGLQGVLQPVDLVAQLVAAQELLQAAEHRSGNRPKSGRNSCSSISYSSRVP